jgi:hypothetical protein
VPLESKETLVKGVFNSVRLNVECALLCELHIILTCDIKRPHICTSELLMILTDNDDDDSIPSLSPCRWRRGTT